MERMIAQKIRGPLQTLVTINVKRENTITWTASVLTRGGKNRERVGDLMNSFILLMNISYFSGTKVGSHISKRKYISRRLFLLPPKSFLGIDHPNSCTKLRQKVFA